MCYRRLLFTLIQAKKLSLVFVITAAILALAAIVLVYYSSAIENNAIMAYPQKQQNKGYHHGEMKPGEYAAGSIASLQNDQNGNPTWIVSGYWKGSVMRYESEEEERVANQTATNANTPNMTTVTTATSNKDATARFKAMFDMVMTNGSAMHNHAIYNFTLMNMSMPNNTTTIFNGTATITMREGPIHNVPVSIGIMDDNVITIWADRTKLNNHFGDTPIYGTVMKHVVVKK
jgi:hypothetical protein